MDDLLQCTNLKLQTRETGAVAHRLHHPQLL
jgi:hypothetical protein